MIRDKTSDVEVMTNLGADRLKMSIDPAGMVHITDLLTNMYSDEELAVIREYSTNARDSHIARGHGQGYNPERPIEVTLPCGPYEIPTEDRGRSLKIRDYGIGLSTEEIAEVYSLYGKSTKDGSDEYNGMMGIGGKCGLVSTFGAFTLTAVKDGIKTVVAVGRNEATEPVMDLASVTETDEPNGVLIEIPTPKHHHLRRKAENLFQFWPEGSVLLDGKEPDKLKSHIKIADDMWIVDEIDHNYARSDWIVMGNVPYPVQLDGKLKDDYSLVVFVSMSAVNIAPSREALRMTQKTKDAITRITAEYDQRVQTVMQDKVNAAESRADAVKVALQWRTAFASKSDFTVKYGRYTIPTFFELSKVHTYTGKMAGQILISEHGSDKLSKHDRNEKIFIGSLVDSVLVHGYSVTGRFAPAHKRKLEAWAKSKGLEPKHYVMTEGRLAHGWIDSTMRVDWETVKAIRLNTVGKGRDNRPKGSYPMWLAGKFHNGVLAADIPLDEDIFWCGPDFMHGREGYSHRSRSRREILTERYPNATIVELTGNRINKFERDFPQARHARTVFDEVYEEIKAKVPMAKRKRFAVEEDNKAGLLRRLPLDRIDDPQVKKAIRWARTKFDAKLKEEMDDALRAIGRVYNHGLGVTWNNPVDRYPLASSANIEHTILYMNAVYAAEVNSK